jgi:hypothetical protein
LFGGFPRTILRVPVAVHSDCLAWRAPSRYRRERNFVSLSHRRPDFIGVFSAGDDEAYALVGRGASNFIATFDIALQ